MFTTFESLYSEAISGINRSSGSNQRNPPQISEDLIDVAGPSGRNIQEKLLEIAQKHQDLPPSVDPMRVEPEIHSTSLGRSPTHLQEPLQPMPTSVDQQHQHQSLPSHHRSEEYQHDQIEDHHPISSSKQVPFQLQQQEQHKETAQSPSMGQLAAQLEPTMPINQISQLTNSTNSEVAVVTELLC